MEFRWIGARFAGDLYRVTSIVTSWMSEGRLLRKLSAADPESNSPGTTQSKVFKYCKMAEDLHNLVDRIEMSHVE
jgi:hypothetical protein